MASKSLKTIIFDMDGTLVDTGAVIANTINYVRIELGLEPMEEKFLLANVNSPDVNPAEFFYGTHQFTDEQTKLFENYYHKHCVIDTSLYDGIEEMLQEFGENFNLAVATNSFDVFANKILNHHDIGHHFDFVIGANNVEKPKPHPDMIHKVMEEFSGVERKNDFILIGDSHKDRLSAKEAGIDYLMVDWGFSDYEDAIINVQDLKTEILKRFE